MSKKICPKCKINKCYSGAKGCRECFIKGIERLKEKKNGQ